MSISVFKDRVKETCDFAGVGNVTMTGPITGSQAFPNGVCEYALENANGTIWEVGKGTVTAGVLVRDTVRDNSSGNTSKVDFGTGTSGGAFITISAKKTNDPFESGQTITWNDQDHTLDIPSGLGNTVQVGQELSAIMYNDTGVTITNGQVVFASYFGEATNGRPHARLAQADTHVDLLTTLFVATHDVADGTEGFFTQFGMVRGIDTSAYALGAVLWLSPTIEGDFTDTPPEFPNYRNGMAIVTEVGVSGSIFTNIEQGVDKTFRNFWNGVIREPMTFSITSNGSVVTGALSAQGPQSFLTMLFSSGFSELDVSTPPTITLTPGTDTVPQMNYVYIPFTTKVLTVSTSGFPVEQLIPIAKVLVRSAAVTATDGVVGNQNINNGLQNTLGQGFLSTLAERLRLLGTSWVSGTEASVTINSTPTPDDVDVAVTGGVVHQLNRQVFDAFNTATGSHIHVINDFTTPYVGITNLNQLVNDASGVGLNNTAFSVVLWGSVNSGGSDDKLFLNLPSSSYAFTSIADAIADPNNFSIYNIPNDYRGTGFLIARFTFTFKNDVWTLEDTEDLRGSIPNVSAGGGVGGVGVTTFLGLTDTYASFVGLAGQLVRVNPGETALESVVPDKNLVGLNNVDNTSDANKPVSTAQQTESDTKLDHTNGVMTGMYETAIVTPALDIDVSASNFQIKSITVDSTFTLSGWGANAAGVLFELVALGTEVISFTGVIWDDAAPVAGTFYRLVFTSIDGGATVRGSIIKDGS